MSAFLGVADIDQPASAYVARHGRVEREFSHLTQSSGNVSWIVQAPEGRLFVKTAGTGAPPPPGASTPYFDHSGRVRLLRNAVDLARSCDHPALPALLNVHAWCADLCASVSDLLQTVWRPYRRLRARRALASVDDRS